VTPPVGAARRVDAHHHLWDLSAGTPDWLTDPALAPLRRTFAPADLHEVAATAGVGASVLVQTEGSAAETAGMLAVAAGDPVIAAVVGWVDLTGASVADDLAAVLAGPGGDRLRGIRHQVQGEPDERWLCRPDVLRGLRAVAAAGLRYDLLTLVHQLPAAIEAVDAVPELGFVLDHCSKPPVASGATEPWASLVRELARRPNVTVKLSGLVTEADWARWRTADLAPYADVVLDAFGPDRVMAGSDWPVCLLAGSYQRVLESTGDLLAGLAPHERDAVLGATATRVYGLSHEPEPLTA
jgi:L-fuconolactonase